MGWFKLFKIILFYWQCITRKVSNKIFLMSVLVKPHTFPFTLPFVIIFWDKNCKFILILVWDEIQKGGTPVIAVQWLLNNLHLCFPLIAWEMEYWLIPRHVLKKMESPTVVSLVFGAYQPIGLICVNLFNTLALNRWWRPLLFFFFLLWLIFALLF